MPTTQQLQQRAALITDYDKAVALTTINGTVYTFARGSLWSHPRLQAVSFLTVTGTERRVHRVAWAAIAEITFEAD